MMEYVRAWNTGRELTSRIQVSLELEKPSKHPLEYAELCEVLFISQVYAEEVLGASNMVEAVLKARSLIQNKRCGLPEEDP